MQCHEFEQMLEQQPEEPLPGIAVAHLDSCELCRGLTADIGAIRTVALRLGAEEATPPERVWISLRNQLEAEGIIHETIAPRESPSHGWWSVFQRPVFAGAFLSFVLVAAGMIAYQNSLPPATNLASQVNRGISQPAHLGIKEELSAEVTEAEPEFQPQDAIVTASLHRNLGVVDNFIALCEKSVREQPDNDVARDYLNRAYEQKAELLATAVDHGTMGGLQ